jgi:hypothetical protein
LQSPCFVGIVLATGYGKRRGGRKRLITRRSQVRVLPPLI